MSDLAAERGGEPAGNERLAGRRPVRRERRSLAVLQPVAQPPGDRVSTGKRDVGRRGHRLAERAMRQAEMRLVHAAAPGL